MMCSTTSKFPPPNRGTPHSVGIPSLGSPVLALSCLRQGRDEAMCAECQPEVANELAHTLNTYREGSDTCTAIETSIEVGDGYASMRKKLASLVNDEQATFSTVPFILIDAPFTDLQDELGDIPVAIRDCLGVSSESIVLVWYPIKQECDKILHYWKEDLASAIRGKPHRLVLSEIWTKPRTVQSNQNKEGALVGSGIAIIHQRSNTADALVSWTKELYDILASDTGGGSWSVLKC